MTKTFSAKQGLVVAMGLALGCAGSDEGGGDAPMFGTTTDASTTGTAPDPDASDDDSSSVCVPGMQTSCACPDGEDGIQVCDADGAGLGPCECSDDSGGDTSTGGPPDLCGNGSCDAEEDCASCEMDCGVCEPCTAAPSCEGAQIPPVIDTHADFLDDPMAYIPPIETLAMLSGHVEGGTEAAAMIAAALAPEVAGEAAFVTALRAAFDANPKGTAAVRRQLANVGMQDPIAYRDTHPAPTQLQVQTAASAALDLTGGAAAGGGPCDDPRMRVRVAMLTVHEEDDDFLNDEVYCAITAEAANASEIKVTPLTPALDEGDDFFLQPRGRCNLGPERSGRARGQPAGELQLHRIGYRQRLQRPADRRR